MLPDSDSRYQSLRSGDADLIWTETPAQFKQAAGNGLRTATRPGSTSTVLFNTKAAPFDDPRVRQALQYAVDREGVEKVVFLGQGTVSDGPIGSRSPYRAANTYPAHDPAKAHALLAGAGHPGLSFDYLVDNRPDAQQRATVLQQMFAEVGVRMTIKPTDAAGLDTPGFRKDAHAQGTPRSALRGARPPLPGHRTETGIARRTLTELADEHGVSRHSPRPPTEIDRNWLYEQYVNQGRTLSALAREKAISRAAVVRWCDIHEIPP